MKLFYRENTGRPLRAAWLLEELGVPYEAIDVPADDPQHLERHPLDHVPAVEFDDGTTLFDSTAIVLQIADAHLDSGLIGRPGSAERGQQYQWILTAMTELELACLDHMKGYEGGRDAFAGAAQAIADELGGRQYLVGDQFSVADIVLVGVLLVGGFVGLYPDAAPDSLVDYVDAMRERPAFQKALESTQSLFRAAA